MNCMRVVAAAIGLVSACLIATLPAQACDPRVPGACAPTPAETTSATEGDSAAPTQPSSRRSERRSRNYRSYRSANKSTRRQRLALKLRARVERKAAAVIPHPPVIKRAAEPTWQLAAMNFEPMGRASVAELAEAAIEPVVAPVAPVVTQAVPATTQAAPAATERKIVLAEKGPAIEAAPPAPVFQPPPATSTLRQVEYSPPGPVMKAASAGPDSSTLRNLFLMFGGVLTLATVFRMVVG